MKHANALLRLVMTIETFVRSRKGSSEEIDSRLIGAVNFTLGLVIGAFMMSVLFVWGLCICGGAR